MIGYILKDDLSNEVALKKLQRSIKDASVLEIGLNDKEQPFIRTDWYVYVLKLQSNTVKIPVIWSASKKPYLIAGIGLVLFLMFFVGGIIVDYMIILILMGLGMVNIFKRREINAMKNAIYDALDK